VTQQSDTTCPKTTELKVVEGEKKNTKDFKAMLLLRQHTKVRDQQILAQTDILHISYHLDMRNLMFEACFKLLFLVNNLMNLWN